MEFDIKFVGIDDLHVVNEGIKIDQEPLNKGSSQ